MIRRGVTEDLAAVARIHVDAWKQVYRGIMPEEVLEKRNYDEQRQAWERKLEKGEEDLYVYEINGNIAGFASCRVIDEGHAEIDTLYFDEKYRGNTDAGISVSDIRTEKKSVPLVRERKSKPEIL